MKTLTTNHQPDNANIDAVTEKKHGNRLLKIIMLIIVLASITLVSSCFVGPPRGAHVRSGASYEQHDNRNNHAGQHDNGNHH